MRPILTTGCCCAKGQSPRPSAGTRGRNRGYCRPRARRSFRRNPHPEAESPGLRPRQRALNFSRRASPAKNQPGGNLASPRLRSRSMRLHPDSSGTCWIGLLRQLFGVQFLCHVVHRVGRASYPRICQFRGAYSDHLPRCKPRIGESVIAGTAGACEYGVKQCYLPRAKASPAGHRSGRLPVLQYRLSKAAVSATKRRKPSAPELGQ